nr:ATP-binding protein [uncultured Undibacterium sp.]
MKSKISPFSSDRVANTLMLGLVLLTLIALYANENWMTRSLRIDALTNLPITVIDDRPAGGNSVAKLRKDSKGLHLDCEIQAGYQWPFCELEINLKNKVSKTIQGIDLSQYDSLKIKVRSDGPEKVHSLRIFLRNFNSAYSNSSLGTTLKPHEIVYDPNQTTATVEFKLSQFMVASWWVQDHPTTIDHLGPELDNVVAMTLTTGGNVTPGAHRISLESAEFVGLWISAGNFRLGIIFVWIIAFLIYLTLSWRRSRQELLESERLKEALKLSNEVLESRVEERTRALASSNSRLINTLQNLEGTRHELVQNEKNAALGALVSGVAHELNTPIGNALLVSTTLSDKIKELEILSETKFTRKALKDFFVESYRGTTILQQNLERAAALISSFKQLSADQHSEQRREFSLNEVVEETRLAMAPTLNQARHIFQADIDPTIVMHAYPGPLSQIFINFINNALLHAFEDIEQGHMLLTAKLITEDTVEIVFSDNGNGIPAHVLRRVFEPFFTTKLGKGGSGLGMHLAHTVVTQIFGGKIDIESIPGEGTSICMVLPLIAPELDQTLIKIGAPKDVVEDYHLFLEGRQVTAILDFSGEYCRRDVVELAFFICAMQTVWPNTKYEIVAVDSYAVGLEQLRSSSIAALATTCWRSDLEAYAEEICMSEAMIADGKSLVGIYTYPQNQHALTCETLTDVQQLRFVSNRDWSADWNTLEQLGISHCLDVKTWQQMVYMVSSEEVDALLAPFSTGQHMNIHFDNCQLIPIPNLRIALQGSRHFASNATAQGQAIAENIFPELQKQTQNGRFELALKQCGFFYANTENWKTLN